MQQPANASLNKSLSSDVGGADGLDGIVKNKHRSPPRNLSRGSSSRSRSPSSPKRSSPSRSSPQRNTPSRGAHNLETYAEANERIRSNSAAKREIIQEQKAQEKMALDEAEKEEEEKLRE